MAEPVIGAHERSRWFLSHCPRRILFFLAGSFPRGRSTASQLNLAEHLEKVPLLVFCSDEAKVKTVNIISTKKAMNNSNCETYLKG